MTSVTLLVYDLSNGLAKSLSSQLLGTHIEAIYHTSVAVFNREIFYGQGISTTLIKQTHFGTPIEEIQMGITNIDFPTFKEFINQLKQRFTAANYHLLKFNCNTFTNEVCQFLVNKSIPSKIINLPSEFLSTPLGQMIQPMIDEQFKSSEYNTVELDEPKIDLPNPLIQYSPLVYMTNESQQLPIKSAIYFFTSSSCQPCQVIKPKFIQLASQLPYPSPLFKPPNYPTAVIIDTQQYPMKSSQFNISAVPTFIKIVEDKITARVQGADVDKLEALFEYTHVDKPSVELVNKCDFIVNKSFNSAKNKEKCGEIGIVLNGNIHEYKTAMRKNPAQWYVIFDHLRVDLLRKEEGECVALLIHVLDKSRELVTTNKSNLLAFMPSLLCACRVFINMFHFPNILCYELVRNGLMQLLPDLIDSALLNNLKKPILEILMNIGVWMAKRQGLKGDIYTSYVECDDDLFMMEYTSVVCEYVNKTDDKEALCYLGMVHLHQEEKELVNVMVNNMGDSVKKYFK